MDALQISEKRHSLSSERQPEQPKNFDSSKTYSKKLQTPLASCKSERADYAGVRAKRWSLSGNELTRNSSGNTQPRSSQLAEPLWTDPGLKSGISVRELTSTKKKKKKHRRRMNGRTFCPNPRKRGKSHHHYHHHQHRLSSSHSKQ